VHSAIGSEQGYLLDVATLDVLASAKRSFLVHVFDLDHHGIDGLIGPSFSNELNDEVRSAEHRMRALMIPAIQRRRPAQRRRSHPKRQDLGCAAILPRIRLGGAARTR
jgi:hypothetical protein